MTTPILATKLYIPPYRSHTVSRPRLIERLDEALHGKLSLISAPAGFGKTTLVSEWIAGCGRPAVWLSLDEDDSDLTRFLTYFVAALQRIEAKIGEGMVEALHSPQPLPTESILTILLNEIAIVPDNFILVLDDYHVIESKPVDNALIFLLEHLPPQIHLVIATREDPLFPLARFRVRDQLTELRATDLRFTPDEAAGFLNQAMDLKLSTEDIVALENRTEGWIAGLQLAAISMQGHHDTTGFITSFTGSHYFVMDYLVEEVLHQQSEGVQKFLLHTSILDRLCGSLCDAVLLAPSASGQNTLEYLDRANLFLVHLDNERRWYRYHHLFAELLRQRLHQNAASFTRDEKTDIAALHLRASLWYEEHGLEHEALHHAFAAEDFERAADLVELTWERMDLSFQAATWLSWVKAIPEELLRSRPVLRVGYAWALLDLGELEAGETRLRDVEQWLNTKDSSEKMVVVDKEQFRLLPITIAAAHAYLATALGDVPNAMYYARQALDILPEGDHLRHGTAASLLGLAYWASGDLETAYQVFVDSLESLRLIDKVLFEIAITLTQAEIRVSQGRLHEAMQIYEHSLQRTMDEDEFVQLLIPSLYLGLSMLRLEQGESDVAVQHVLRSKEHGEHGALPDWQCRWRLAEARIKEAQGDLDGALDLLHQAERVFYRTPMPDLHPIPALKARVKIKQGRLTDALVWLRERDLSIDDDLSFLCEFEHITLVRLLLARFKNDHTDHSLLEAVELLARLLKAAEEGKRMGSVIEILVLQALVHEAQDNIPLALQPLKRALTLAEPEGYVRIFVNEGMPMVQLLSEAAVQGIMPDYIGKLLTFFDAEEQTNEDISSLPPAPSAQPLLDPLSERELEVLQLIAQGLSNREISERLFLALSTVKGHNQKIFGKLEVQRRTEAVARARELGLL